MEILNTILNFILETLLQEIIVVIAGVLFAQFIYSIWVKWRYGGWRVILKQNGKDVLNRAISPGKAKGIISEESELAVFLKGVASPYAWIKCDLLEEGRNIGMLVEDSAQRLFVIDLDKNPANGIAQPEMIE